ncbi:MAG: molecular chaperone DnaK [Candidatus Lokiarchaeota archaeon]|nr:molecular chaperone DnaK [Candidatus Harpocratesius repetitus]
MTNENEKKTRKEKILGIDLGTSNSAAAVMIGGKPEIIPAAEGVSLGGKAFPSYVAFLKDGTRLVGEPARRQAISNPDRTIRKIKRKMGTSEKIRIDNKEYTPEEISAMILQKIKKDSEDYLGEKIEKAVITVPAYFNDSQRTATKDAGRIAGLDVVRIINEPTAACIAYGLDKTDQGSMKVAVLDLGGGTFDVTIMEMGEGVFEVLSTSGDTALGGTDMDEVVKEWIISEFKKQTDVDLSNDSQAMMRIIDAAEKAKIELSTTYSTQINLPFIAMGKDGQPLSLDLELTRAKFEELIDPILNRLIPPMERALRDSKLKKSDIKKIIMVGGPSRMPSVQKVYEDFFGRKPEKGIDPMECVAQGAAIQGGVLSGEVEDLLLLDVTPLTLSIETLGGVATPLIERNTTIPVERSKVFSTATDNQPSVEIHVIQGERPMAKDNITLGRFHLDGIPPAPRGVPQIEVTFSIDQNGIVHVNAKDLGTGKEQSITITGQSKLTEEEIQAKIRDAEKHAEEDKKIREQIETKNEADALAFQAEKMMKEHADKLDDDLKNKLVKAIDDVKDALKSENINRIKEAKTSLEEHLHKLAEKIYAQGGAPGGMGGMGGMDPAQAAKFAQQAAQGGAGFGSQGGATYEQPSGKSKEKKKVVDVEWEDE